MHISPTSLEGQTLLECVCAPTRREPEGLLMLQSLGSMYSCSGCALHKGTTYTWMLFPLQISSLFCKIFKFLLLLYWLQWWDIYTQCPSNNNKIFWVFCFFTKLVYTNTQRGGRSLILAGLISIIPLGITKKEKVLLNKSSFSALIGDYFQIKSSLGTNSYIA